MESAFLKSGGTQTEATLNAGKGVVNVCGWRVWSKFPTLLFNK